MRMPSRMRGAAALGVAFGMNAAAPSAAGSDQIEHHVVEVDARS
jgi:hypothetical protein